MPENLSALRAESFKSPGAILFLWNLKTIKTLSCKNWRRLTNAWVVSV